MPHPDFKRGKMTPRLISNHPISPIDQIAEVTTYQGSMSLRIYAHGFLELASVGVKASLHNQASTDSIVPPILYAIRHATELFLKYIITEISEQDTESSPPFLELDRKDRHSLSGIFQRHQHKIAFALECESTHTAWDYRNWIKQFENLLLDVDNIDPDGQVLRYPTDMTGKPNLNGKISISVEQIGKFVDEVYRCFSDFIERDC